MKARAGADRPPSAPRLPRCVWWVGGSGLVSWWLYVAFVWLSRGFAYETPGPGRPLIPVLCVLAALFGLYVFQVVCATQYYAPNGATMPVIVVFAIAFRLLLLFSEPIQEVDAYRYLWDGKVAAAGVSPFKYSPEQILTANAVDSYAAEDLRLLVELRDQSAANIEILRRVHFGQLTTVYPPVSQAVFTAAACVTPHAAAVQTHLLIVKSFIVAFDLATFWLLIGLLTFVGRPAEWSIVYAWCPLVMKEFANSGHLDSIAVFLTVATVYCAVRAFYPLTCGHPDKNARSPMPQRTWTFLSAIALSLAVGAKIYPIVLAPLLFLSAWQKVSRTVAVSVGILVLTLASVMVLPMLFRDRSDERRMAESVLETSPVPNETLAPANPSPPRRSGPNIDPDATGLVAFAGQWQMNDFLFLLLFENFKPLAISVAADQSSPEEFEPDGPPLPSPQDTDNRNTNAAAPIRIAPTAWFVVTTPEWRRQFVDKVAGYTILRPGQVPFLAARLLTSGIFLMLALGFAWNAMRSDSPGNWLGAAFLTIAWFWLLLPTQNPWYWTWALTFVPFARSRAWLAMSGLTLLYYMRFWFAYHASSTPMLGTPYAGVEFFDYVVTWIEYCPWFLWLMWTARRQNRSDNGVANII